MPFCDIVMKGGVTSGVVYPLAIAELSKRFIFRNIGGTSAGAIAACITAAAEYRRHRGSDAGFTALSNLPVDLGAGDPPKLFALFEPDDEARSAFAVASAFLGESGGFVKGLRVLATAILHYPHFLAIAMIPLIGIFFAPRTLMTVVAGFAAALGGLVLFALLIAGWITFVTLRQNRFGLCSGRTLTTWLHEQINGVAERPLEKPLTFGELEACEVSLRMVTTNLTHGRPYNFPQGDDRLYFRVEDMEPLFPPEVVQHLVAKSPANENGFYRLPESSDLPIVFAARLSLSFPVLFTLVPLYAVLYSRSREEMTLCWFIDGGLTSNFPIHFFDAALPQWPTFGLDLGGKDPDYDNEVYMVESNRGGLSEKWNVFAPSVSEVLVHRYVGAIIGTMQSWRDNTQQRLPGYRDRIAHIKLSGEEGGLNLRMPLERIRTLAARGRVAGKMLSDRFAPGATHDMNWDNHRWIRYLTTMALVEGMLQEIGEALTRNANGGTSYAALLRRRTNVPKTGYWTAMTKLKRVHRPRTAALLRTLRLWRREKPPFDEVAPKPSPALQMTPPF